MNISQTFIERPSATSLMMAAIALFGAVAAGVFDDINSAIEATRPKKVRTYEPDLEAKKTYDRVYEIYRALYEFLGRSDVRLMHELKRIGTERSGA